MDWDKGLDWTEKKDKELRNTITQYISEGIDKKTAVETVLKSSTLGAGYNAQIRHDFIGFTV